MARTKKTRRFVIAVTIFSGVILSSIVLLSPPKGYTNLENLVMALSVAIDDRDEAEVARLCHEPLEVSFDRLARQHAKVNYVTLLHENRGWSMSNSWTLGGHGARYGHIHVNLVKQLDNKWYLKRIWGCR